MNAELEALILALDAVLTARTGADAKRLEAIYQARLDDTLSRAPGLAREKMILLVASRHKKWVAAQRKFSSLPPSA